MTITVDHVRELLGSDSPDATLVLVGGRPKITTTPAAENGLVVASRADLWKDRDTPPGDEDLRRLAEILNTTVSELGG
ncbi:hypothetical protein [Thermomonospora amylolytica]|uniref:hypothetical protein n=1 Tax=Thermomonospora amylolytica TaxID=1411117 RepID=UPI000E6C320B|nr:hypothetical protein [Thermomonospora amylolytica]